MSKASDQRRGEASTSASASASAPAVLDQKNGHYQPVAEQLADTLPTLTSFGKTTRRSKASIICATDCMEAWEAFAEDAIAYIQSINPVDPKTGKSRFKATLSKVNLSKIMKGKGRVSPPTAPTVSTVEVERVDRPHHFSVGSEDGVRGIITDLIYEPVINCMKESSRAGVINVTASMGDLTFGDPQAVQLPAYTQTPPDTIVGTILNEPGRLGLRAVGEIKTPWTCRLGSCSIADSSKDASDQRILVMGQIFDYMIKGGLRYGFFITYEHVVFVRAKVVREDEQIKFELTVPIGMGDKSPSLREAFFYFLSLIDQDHHHIYPPTATELLVPARSTTKENPNKADFVDESSPKKRKASVQFSLGPGPSSSSGHQQATAAGESASASTPTSGLEPIMATTTKNTKENVSATGSPRKGSRSGPLTESRISRLSEKQVQESSAAATAVRSLPTPSVAASGRSTSAEETGTPGPLTGESHSSPAGDSPTSAPEEQPAAIKDLSEFLTPDSCMAYDHNDDERDDPEAVFNPTTVIGEGDRGRVWRGNVFWKKTGQVFPCYFKVYKEEDRDLQWWYEVTALCAMKGTGASTQPITWGYTTGNKYIPDGYYIATLPVRGQAHEPEWWLDPNNKIWLEELLEVLGQFRRKGFVVYDVKPWDVLVDEENETVKIIDLESCIQPPVFKAHELSYGVEMREILDDPYIPSERYGWYTGPLDYPVEEQETGRDRGSRTA
ncbi:hypothetical protein ABW21_db0207457 [Orbilia brochopaga]|nr:hypothetical protein ABW21_db0207457 [Drechslerella brochopaga]